jgi:hypothetical protein
MLGMQWMSLLVQSVSGDMAITVRDRRDGASALSDLRLLLNQPPRKLGGSYFFFFLAISGPWGLGVSVVPSRSWWWVYIRDVRVGAECRVYMPNLP